MPVDASIALQGRAVQDPLQSYGNALSLKSLINQQKAQENQLAQYAQEQDQQKTLADLYRGNIGVDGQVNRQGLLQDAASRGLGARIPGLQKSFADSDKAAADAGYVKAQTGEVNVKTQAAGLKLIGEAVSQLASNPNLTHDDVINAFARFPADIIPPDKTAAIVRNLPGNPQQLRQTLLMYGANAEQRLKALTPELQAVNLGGTTQLVDKNAFTNPGAPGQSLRNTQSPDNAASVAATLRGQNMQDSRARESTAATMTKPFEVTGPDGQPVLVQQDKQGNITPVQGYSPKGMGATKLTEDQGKATGWLSQATNAFDNMKGAIATNPGAAKPGIADAVSMVPGLGYVGNALRGDNRQKYMQASSSMSEALLRAATGAGVNESEARQKIGELTPQFGDSDAVIQQKMEALPVYIESLKVRAGPGAKQVPEIMSKARAQALPKAGNSEDGYIFLGGDPADSKNWKKQ